MLIDPETGRVHARAVLDTTTLTDLSGKSGEPRIETLWSIDGRLIRDVHHPDPYGGADLFPCEHYDETEVRRG